MNISDAVLAIFMLLVTWSFYLAQKDPNNVFNLFDLVMENGRLSRIACAFMVTLVATTWIVIRLTFDGKMTEGYFIGYGGMWVAPIIAKMLGAPMVLT